MDVVNRAMIEWAMGRTPGVFPGDGIRRTLETIQGRALSERQIGLLRGCRLCGADQLLDCMRHGPACLPRSDRTRH